MYSWFQHAGWAIHDRDIFVGCPIWYFEPTAKDPLLVALAEGLQPNSSVLEVGCGCLRTGFWFIDYLQPDRYCGIEPNGEMLAAGREVLLRTVEAEKRPRFDTNDRFDFGVFGRKFDLVFAYSIWSHAPKASIARMLEQFRATGNPGAKFIASWFPDKPDYAGSEWVGRSHRSQTPGVIGHREPWLRSTCEALGLQFQRYRSPLVTLGQTWAVVTRGQD
jgi:hypothetical protein